MVKEALQSVSYHCPDCSYKLGNRSYSEGDFYTCLCPKGYWEMNKDRNWIWKIGERPRKEKLFDCLGG